MSLAVAMQTSSQSGLPYFEASAKIIRIYFTITASGSYSTGGDTLDLTQLFSSIPGLDIPVGAMPLKLEIMSAHGTGTPQTAMFVYNFAPGSTLANGKMQVFTGAAAQAGLTELSAGAYPAGVTGDSITAEVVFPRL